MLSTFELELLEAQNHTKKPSGYDRVKDILLPGVAAAGTIVSIVLDKPVSVTWAMALVTMAFTGYSAYPPIIAAIRRRIANAADENAARHYFPQFLQFVQRYGNFVDSRTCDTLHALVGSSLTEPSRSELLKRLGTPNVALWNTRCHFFSQRMNRVRPSFVELQSAFQEFHSMVAEFNSYCVTPIFEHLPEGLRSGLTHRDKSMLNGFQQNFAHFLDDYMEFGKEMVESRPGFSSMHYYVSRPNPL